MSKKHFIALADALLATRPQDDSLEEKAQWARDVRAIAEVCLNTNRMFNYQRWMAYIKGECGPNGGKL